MTQERYADKTGAGGKLSAIKSHLEDLMRRGLYRGISPILKRIYLLSCRGMSHRYIIYSPGWFLRFQPGTIKFGSFIDEVPLQQEFSEVNLARWLSAEITLVWVV